MGAWRRCGSVMAKRSPMRIWKMCFSGRPENPRSNRDRRAALSPISHVPEPAKSPAAAAPEAEVSDRRDCGGTVFLFLFFPFAFPGRAAAARADGNFARPPAALRGLGGGDAPDHRVAGVDHSPWPRGADL